MVTLYGQTCKFQQNMSKKSYCKTDSLSISTLSVVKKNVLQQERYILNFKKYLATRIRQAS